MESRLNDLHSQVDSAEILKSPLFQTVSSVDVLDESPEEEESIFVDIDKASPPRPDAPLLTIPIPSPLNWPKELGEAAFHGLTGEIVRAIEPHTEADVAALLSQFLVAFGNVVGRSPHFIVEADQHFLNLYLVLTGNSSKGRKGTSWAHILKLFKSLDEDWAETRVQSGLSTGEGLILSVQSEAQSREDGVRIVDKRLLVNTSEFASVLKVMTRHGNNLSPVLRSAWDQGNLQVMTKNQPLRVTDAHLSLIGHITKDELKRSLRETESVNGFANRFLWICAKRSKCLPEGGQMDEVDLAPLLNRLKEAIDFAREVKAITRDDAARRLWREIYPELSQERHGLAGAVTSRGEAQVIRIACIYALLDFSDTISIEHLEAALAVWKYVEDSAAFIFDGMVGNHLADEILSMMKATKNGLTRTQISGCFNRNKKGPELNQALSLLKERSMAKCVKECGLGRPVERWYAI